MKTRKQLEKLENEIKILSNFLKSHRETNSERCYVLYINNNTEELHICDVCEDNSVTCCSESLDNDYIDVSPDFTANDIRLIAGYLEKKNISGYGKVNICGNCIRSLYGNED